MRGYKDPLRVMSPETTLERDVLGGNSGNLLFSQAAYATLLVPETDITVSNFFNLFDRPERVNERYDAVVLPFANAFRPGFAALLERFTALIERLTIPVSVLGIGAQSDLDYGFEPLAPIEPTVRRFARAVLERSPSIGVRGEFTEAYLKRLGFRDVEVIGCPSLFANGPTLPVRDDGRSLGRDARIALTAGRGDDARIGELVMAHHVRYRNLVYVAQGNADLDLMLWGESRAAAADGTGIPRHLSHPLYREDKVRFFIDAATWIRYLADFDFSFGTRFHGNVAALLAGTPAHVIAHDSRTLELARYFEMPYTKATALTGATDAAQLLEGSDFARLVGGHRERFERFVSFLERHGLEHVHTDPPGRRIFDERLAGLRLPPPVAPLASAASAELASRMRWLKATHARRVKRLSAQVSALEQRLGELERSGPAPPPAAPGALRRRLGRLGRLRP